jgi:tRNA G18 (ribose-2'-O)-methylase SpoU
MDLKTDDRNVTDFYKYWDIEAIKANLDTKRNEFVVVVERVNGDFNFSTIVRNCNAFLGKRVVRCGIKKWDKRGAVGTNHYEHVEYSDSIMDVLNQYRNDGYRIVAIDNVGDAKVVNEHSWVAKSVMVFGEEGRGLSDEVLAFVDDVVYIEQYGSVRSLNIGTASGIVMYDYCSKVV